MTSQQWYRERERERGGACMMSPLNTVLEVQDGKILKSNHLLERNSKQTTINRKFQNNR